MSNDQRWTYKRDDDYTQEDLAQMDQRFNTLSPEHLRKVAEGATACREALEEASVREEFCTYIAPLMETAAIRGEDSITVPAEQCSLALRRSLERKKFTVTPRGLIRRVVTISWRDNSYEGDRKRWQRGCY